MNPDQEPKDKLPLSESHLPPKTEAEFMNRRTFLITGGLIVGVIVFVLVASAGLNMLFQATNPLQTNAPLARVTQLPPEPRIVVNEPLTLQRVQETAQANISQYGFVDQQAGIVRIPVEDAMKIIAEQGVRPSTGITSTQGLTTSQTTDLAQRGAQLFQANGCSACHTDTNTGTAPTLKGIYGKPVQLEGGQMVTADEAYIKQSILDPSSQIVAGYSARMPSFANALNDLQIGALIAYIKSLGGQ